jgi:hypothetical protein
MLSLRRSRLKFDQPKAIRAKGRTLRSCGEDKIRERRNVWSTWDIETIAELIEEEMRASGRPS